MRPFQSDATSELCCNDACQSKKETKENLLEMISVCLKSLICAAIKLPGLAFVAGKFHCLDHTVRTSSFFHQTLT